MLTECEKFALLDCQDETERLVLSNLELANYIAHRYRWTGEDLEDLIQWAREGLVKAAKGYKPNSETKFSTYAYIAMNRTIRSALFGNPNAPKNKVDVVVVSLQMPISEDGRSYMLEEIIPDDKDCIHSKIEDLILSQCIGDLDKKQQIVIRQRYLEDRKYRDIGNSLGISHEGVRQIERKALEKMRKAIG